MTEIIDPTLKVLDTDEAREILLGVPPEHVMDTVQEGGIVRLVTRDDHVLGIGVLPPDTGELVVYIAEPDRYAGLGEELVLDVFEQARAQGYEKVLARVLPDTPAHHLATKLGFRQTRRAVEDRVEQIFLEYVL